MLYSIEKKKYKELLAKLHYNIRLISTCKEPKSSLFSSISVNDDSIFNNTILHRISRCFLKDYISLDKGQELIVLLPINNKLLDKFDSLGLVKVSAYSIRGYKTKVSCNPSKINLIKGGIFINNIKYSFEISNFRIYAE